VFSAATGPADAVWRSMQGKAGAAGLSPRQGHVLEDPAHDDRDWVLSAAHLDVVPGSRLTINESLAKVVPVTDDGTPHNRRNEILDQVVASIRSSYASIPDPAGGPVRIESTAAAARDDRGRATGEAAAWMVEEPARLLVLNDGI
jgi:ADP-ribose pyrophosphatase YjhB (NUDIX family)